LDKIKRDSSIYHKFIDYLYEESLENKNHIKISYDDNFYRDNCSFYLVLYDMVYIYYTDTIYVVNSLKYLNFGNEMTFTHSHSILFNFLIEKNFSTYLHYQTKLSSKNGTFYNISIINEEGEEIINDTFNSVSGYIEIEPNVKYYAHINLFEIDTKEILIFFEAGNFWYPGIFLESQYHGKNFINCRIIGFLKIKKNVFFQILKFFIIKRRKYSK